jgi:CubicO group peptidase (beta-lactamase class C family)
MQKRARTFFLGLVAVAGFGVAAAQQPPAIAASPAGRAFSAWLKAFDSGDRETLKRFMQAYEPQRLPKLDDEMEFARMTGGFDLRKVEKSTPSAITALVQERLSDQFARLTFQVQSTPPYRITSGSIEAVDRPAEFALPHLSQDDLIAQLKDRLQRETGADRFAGAVLVAKDGRPIFRQAYGFADRERKIPNTVDTKFRIGSMNKMFTATAVMQLAQAGKLDLDKPFGAYLTDYPNNTVSSSVTIRQLLTHTGGTGDIFTPEYFKNRLNVRTLQDYIKLFGKRPLQFKPGSKWDYSNYGFILLGAVIEKVSGENYYDYVREHIYKPAGMTQTGSEPEDVNVPNRSVGYMVGANGDWKPNTDTLPYRGTSAGGGYTTVGDFLKFADALMTNTLLSAQYTQMMTSGKVPTPMGNYAFGFDDHVVNGTRCFGHGGGPPGMNGNLEICPASGYTIVVLANLDPPAASRISDFITNRLPLNR